MNPKESARYQLQLQLQPQQSLPPRLKPAMMVQHQQQQQPTWSGPRLLIIPRSDDGFGFTLRQLVTEPPLRSDANGADVYCEPMASFHVSSVKKGSNAELAGLQAGDRVVSVDGQSTTGRTFADVVQQMQSNYGNMQLLVVPKHEDVVQLTMSAREGQITANAVDVAGPSRQQLGSDGMTSAAAKHPAGDDLPAESWGVRREGHSAGNYVQLSPAAQSPTSHGPWLQDMQGGHLVHGNSGYPHHQQHHLQQQHLQQQQQQHLQQQQQRVQQRVGEPYSVPFRATRALTFSGQQQLPAWQPQTRGQPYRVDGQSLQSHTGLMQQQQQQLQVVRATVTSVVTPSDSKSVAAAGPSAADRLVATSLAMATRAAVASAAAAAPANAGPVLSYQLSAPRLPQQVIRAPVQVVGPGQTGRQAGPGDGGSAIAPPTQQQQASLVRYLPAYHGSDVGSPPAAVVLRTPRAGAPGGQRPATSYFDSTAASYQLSLQQQQQPLASQDGSRWASVTPPHLAGAERRGSCHPVQQPVLTFAAFRTAAEPRRDTHVAASGTTGGGGLPLPRSPVQQETTFDTRGMVEQCQFIYEPGSGFGQQHAAGDFRGLLPAAAAELRWRVASDNDLLAARHYSDMQQLTSASSSSLLLHGPGGSAAQLIMQRQQQASAAAVEEAASLKASASLGSLQQQQLLFDQALQSRALPSYSGTAAAAGLPGSAGGRRDRLPSDAPGMTYNQGFTFGPPSSAASSGQGSSSFVVVGGGAGVQQRLSAAAAARTRPMSSYVPATGNVFSLLDRDTADYAASMPAEESQSLDHLGRPLLPLHTGDEQLQALQRSARSKTVMNKPSSSDDSGKTQVIRRSSYMLATAARPRLEDASVDSSTSAAVAPAGRPVRRSDFLGDPSATRYPVYELHLSRDSSEEAGEGATPPPAVAVPPRFDLSSSSDATLSTPLPPSPLPINRQGNLAVKVERIDGKKSSDRSWKTLGVVLCGRLLYLIKERKENVVLNQASDDIPINLRSCRVDVAYGYTKKKNVFRLETASCSEYLFQAEDQEDMLSWIREILLGSDTDKGNASNNAETIMRHIEQKLDASQSPVPSGSGANKTGGSIGGGNTASVRRLAVLPFWNRQQSPGSDVPPGNKKERKAARLLQRGTSSPATLSAAGASEDDGASYGSTRAFGIPLAECSPSLENEFIPNVVEQCTKAIEGRGLEFTGLYRIPGNSVAVGVLQDELNSGIVDQENERWHDVNVVGSLLKLFFRKLPEPLVTAALYKSFIEANRIEKYEERMNRLKQLIHELPEHNFETFKYLANHLRRVANLGHINKMDAHNLAIVFGPTLLRSADDSMLSIVADMAGQCGVIETVISHNEWMFSAIGEPPPEAKATLAHSLSSAAPISETMQSISDDMVKIASKQLQMLQQQQQLQEPQQHSEHGTGASRRELIAATITSAAARFLRSDGLRAKSKQQQHSTVSVAAASTAGAGGGGRGLGGGGASGPAIGSSSTSSSSSDGGDHGFAERNIDEEVAARRLRLREHEAAKQQQQLQPYGDVAGRQRGSAAAAAGWLHAAVLSAAEPLRSRSRLPAAGSASEDPELLRTASTYHRQLAEKTVSRWHSEESVLDQLHHQQHQHGGGGGFQRVPSAGVQSSLSPPWRQPSQQAFEPQQWPLPDGSFHNGITAAGAVAHSADATRSGSAAPSPPPPPLPARRYRSPSEEDAAASHGGEQQQQHSSIYQVYFSGGRGAASQQQPSLAVAAVASLPHQPRRDWPLSGTIASPQPNLAAQPATAGSNLSGRVGMPGPAHHNVAPTYQNVFAQSLAYQSPAEPAGEWGLQARAASAFSPVGASQQQQQQQVPFQDQRRTSSMDSTFSGSDHSSDLLATITSTFDQKLQRLLFRDVDDDGGTSDDRAAETPEASRSPAVALSGWTQGSRSGSLAGGSAGDCVVKSTDAAAPAAVAAAAPSGTVAASQHSFRDPSLNKCKPISARSGGAAGAKQDPPGPAAQLQQQQPGASEHAPVQTTKIGIASRIERTDMKPSASQLPTMATAALLLRSPGYGGGTAELPPRRLPLSAGPGRLLRQALSGSYDSLVNAESPSCAVAGSSHKRGDGGSGALSKNATAVLGSREGLVRSFVDKFEQKSQQSQLSPGAAGSAVRGSCSVSNLASLGGSLSGGNGGGGSSRDAEALPARRKTGGSSGKKRTYRRHTIGGNLTDDYVSVATAVALTAAAAAAADDFSAAASVAKYSQQQQEQHQSSAWDRLQPMVRQYEGAALRSVHDWIASERGQRARGSFSDLYGMQAAAASPPLLADTAGGRHLLPWAAAPPLPGALRHGKRQT